MVLYDVEHTGHRKIRESLPPLSGALNLTGMIQKKVIDSIYKKFKKRPASPDELDIPLLFEKVPLEAAIEIDGDHLVINSIESSSPFHSIPINHIHAIIEFDEAVAIVLHSSILFISKEDGSVHVHLKDIGMSLLDRVKAMISKG